MEQEANSVGRDLVTELILDFLKVFNNYKGRV